MVKQHVLAWSCVEEIRRPCLRRAQESEAESQRTVDEKDRRKYEGGLSMEDALC